jgi:hypothetical protein
MAIEEEVGQPTRPIAWGQIVVGSVIGGLALWSMALDLFGVTPSALLAGVATAYQGWRDWVLTPLLGQFDITLSPVNRDILAFVAVMAGAWVRTAIRYPEAADGLIDLILWPSLMTVGVFFLVPDRWSPSFGVEFWITIAAILCTMRLFIRPAAGLAASALVDEYTAAHLASLTTPAARFGLWNALAVLVFAAGLFAFDWATQ